MEEPQVKRNHHTLPRLYLKGFAESHEKPFVWVYKKGKLFNPGAGRDKHNPVRMSIKSASVIPYAYSYTRRDGIFDPDSFENELEKLEKPSDPILKKVRSRIMIDANEKRVLASYILLMHKRVPQREDRAREEWGKILETSPTIRALRSPELLSQLPERRRREVEELLVEYEKEPPKELLLKTMVMEWGRAPAYLSKMIWRFLVADGGAKFFTSDYPVFTSALGLIKVPAELTFPISSDITLHASWQRGEEGFFSAPPEFVDQLNHRTAANAEQIFHCKSERWITKLLNRKDHPIYLLDVSGHLRQLMKYREVDVRDSWLA